MGNREGWEAVFAETGKRFCPRCSAVNVCCELDDGGECLGRCNDIGMHDCERCGDLKLSLPRELTWARNWCPSCAGQGAA